LKSSGIKDSNLRQPFGCLLYLLRYLGLVVLPLHHIHLKTLRIHVGITSFRKIIGFLSFPHPFEMYQSMQVS
jgi:hypothetical protein